MWLSANRGSLPAGRELLRPISPQGPPFEPQKSRALRRAGLIVLAFSAAIVVLLLAVAALALGQPQAPPPLVAPVPPGGPGIMPLPIETVPPHLSAIAQDAARLTLEYQVFSRYDLQPPLKFVFPLDGSEGRNSVMLGRGEQVESSRARWDGQTLVIVTTLHVDDRAAGKPFTTEVTRKMWLESPATLIVEVTRAGVLGGAASTTRSVYRKS